MTAPGPAPSPWRRWVPVLVVAATIGLVGWQTVRPGVGAAAAERLAGGFGFEQVPANSTPAGARDIRAVEPPLQSIRQWISAVGAAVALTDLRGLGRPADLCLVDPRDDTVTLASVPGSGAPDYPRVTLTPDGLPYDATMAPMGCVPADVDEDGRTDLLVYYWGRSPVVFLHTGSARSVTASTFTAHELVSPMQVWNTTALNVADVDGSGHLSVVIGNYFPDGARVLDTAATSDPLMQMQDGMGMAHNAGLNRLLALHPTGVAGRMPAVTDESSAMPAESRRSWTLAIGLQDLTDTGLPSMYVANDFGPDQLLVNCSTPGAFCFTASKGDRTLTDPKSKVLGRDSFKGMGVTFSYPSGGGLPTIVVSNITSEWALQESNFAFVPHGDAADVRAGRVPWTDDSEPMGLSRSGWSWDVKAGDFDNSGTDEFVQAEGFLRGDNDKWAQLQELATGNQELLPSAQVWPSLGPGDGLSGDDQNCFYVRDGDGRYTDVSGRLGLDQPGVSRGFALGDVNGDGRLDAVVANQWADSTVLLNTAPAVHPAVDLTVVRPGATGAPVPAIGVAARVDAARGLPAQATQLFYGNGHAGASAADLHLAVPGADRTTVHLSWRDAAGRHTADVAVTPGHHTIAVLPDGKAELR